MQNKALTDIRRILSWVCRLTGCVVADLSCFCFLWWIGLVRCVLRSLCDHFRGILYRICLIIGLSCDYCSCICLWWSCTHGAIKRNASCLSSCNCSFTLYLISSRGIDTSNSRISWRISLICCWLGLRSLWFYCWTWNWACADVGRSWYRRVWRVNRLTLCKSTLICIKT